MQNIYIMNAYIRTLSCIKKILCGIVYRRALCSVQQISNCTISPHLLDQRALLRKELQIFLLQHLFR